MQSLQVCKFCNIISGNPQYPEVDFPLAESKEFIAISSIGALVEGWTLIVPKDHCLSMTQAYGRNCFIEFINPIINQLHMQYGDLICFEHGANKIGSETGCGINHAHLHLVPFKESLLEDIFLSEEHWVHDQAAQISSISQGNEYLFYSELKKSQHWDKQLGWIHILKKPSSQFFRRIIAKKLGNEDISDYKHFPFFETALRTRQVFTNGVNKVLSSK